MNKIRKKTNINEDKLILVGKIQSPIGLEGLTSIVSFTNPILNIFKLPLIDNQHNKYTLTLIRVKHKNILISKVNNINHIDQIKNLQLTELFCMRSNLPNLLSDNEFYIEDLINLPVLDHKSLNKIGVVNKIYNFGAGDLIEIKLLNNQYRILPFLQKIFVKINPVYLSINIYLANPYLI